ncbi:hypothetical protein Csa_023617, partial [Cucumis sativus]
CGKLRVGDSRLLNFLEVASWCWPRGSSPLMDWESLCVVGG